MDADQAGEQRVLDALGDLGAVLAVGVEHDGVVGHQVADVAHEHQAAAGQGELAAVGGGVGAVLVEHPGEGLVALADFLAEVAAVEPEPVAVAEHLVVGVDGGHRVLEVHDRGDRRLQHDVLDACLIGRADRGVRVDQDLDVQAVVDQQHRSGVVGFAEVAGELPGIGEAGREVVTQSGQHLTGSVLYGDLEPLDVGPRARRERDGTVEEPASVGDDLVAAHLVVSLPLLGTVGLGDDVGAVQRVVERAPPGVGRVERKARVEDRHHQLRTGCGGDLVVDTRGGDREVRGLLLQVADAGEELLVVVGLEVADDAGPVPLVDLRLQPVAAGEQVLVLRGQIGDELVDAGPERVGVEVGTRQRLTVDEVVQHGGDAQVTHRHAFGHGSSLAGTCASGSACRMHLSAILSIQLTQR